MQGKVAKLPKALSDRLNKLSQLPENWDSYGAPPISGKTIDRAASVLHEILAIGTKEVPLPFIGPAGDGTIVMEWKTSAGKELILDIPPNDELLGFLLVEPTASGEEETEGTIGKPWSLKQIIQRLSAV